MKIKIYTDGGSRGNPGPSAIGVVIIQEGEASKKYGEYIGEGTNNQAEYKAVIFALKKVKQLFGKQKAKGAEITVLSDSELLVKHINHQYKIKEGELQSLFLEVWNLMLDFNQVNFQHTLRGGNKEADEMVNRALDEKSNKQTLL
ncbi:ribonuclease HI family protein [Patescibacteria group bacterium]|nr:ribonuclease HI family protein [Patescibacteria group bacterium]MBU2579787.1 ribonuclease HI family protein [Patescibacteria group bacterium]